MSLTIPLGLKLFLMVLIAYLCSFFKADVYLLFFLGVVISLVHPYTRWLGILLLIASVIRVNEGHSAILSQFQILSEIKSSIRESIINSDLSKNAKGLVFDLSVADKSLIPVDFKRTMYDAGIAHLIAVSGMHIGIIFFAIDKALSFSALSLRSRNFIAFLIVLLYGALTGFTIPVMRALFMVLIYVFSKVLWSKTTSINVLFLTASLIAFLFPEQLKSLSFQLSFTGVLGIILGFRLYTYQGTYLKSFLINSFLASVYAQLALFPLLLYYFKCYSLYSLLLGFCVFPLFMFLIVLIPVFLIGNGSFVTLMIKEGTALIQSMCSTSLMLPQSKVYVPTFDIWSLLISYLLLFSLWLCLSKKKLKYIPVVLVALIGLILN